MTVVTYTYDAWGRQLSCTGSMASTLGTLNPLRYRGYVYDQETNLYYLQSRYYNPEIGRFLNADGYTTTGQGFVGNNMFAYCNNNPVMFADPTGYFLERIVDSIKQMIDRMKFLCSRSSPPDDYIEDNSETNNCTSYAFGYGSLVNPGDWHYARCIVNNGTCNHMVPMYSSEKKIYSVEEVVYLAQLDALSANRSFRCYSTLPEASDGEYVIAVKTSDKILLDEGFADYHFAVLLSDGTWADKPGITPSRWNKIDGTARYWDYIDDDGEIEENYYNSPTLYIVIGR